jgi:ribosomal protein L37AE/L43A
MGAGIDYGRGLANIDHETGIRYGVLPVHAVGQTWYDAAEDDYGPGNCGYCGSENISATDEHEMNWKCNDCGETFADWERWPDEPRGFTYEDSDYSMSQGGESTDIFVLRSPYYTWCRYCSPCAPGAGYLLAQDAEGIKAYCPGHDWFESGVAPYAVYRVADDTLIMPAEPTTTLEQWQACAALDRELTDNTGDEDKE